MNPLQTDNRLILYLDIKSPYAYLAKDEAKELERLFDITIDWRPLTLNIPSFLGSARVNEHREVVEENRTPRQWQAVRYAYYDVKRYARLRETLVYGPRKVWDTTNAHLGWLYARQQSRYCLMNYLDDVYERFWKRDFDPEDLSQVESALQNAGCETGDFSEYTVTEGRDRLAALQRALPEAGIFGVPTFVIDGEVLFGREHLPRINWILSGRNGKSPDVAYQLIEQTA